ncbi:STM4011 family radical SAM protein [Paenibacillus sp. 19GGS1-52]|uniref:STM4011 family radical SAM protein n=1 Tax=Paenibacillus sp. 19GGS1-52 TaxID=2758563 RepID=UPI001EFAA8D2|nr:STM4011 family radical SAM protein [Paenibacillus sp. 19GGS1-52]ULO06564.1 STM4011 family radical SAM protein [Paenibacillus sp. 19GGS1-52]
MKAVLYYRGSLTSCNYDCPYCPFGKTRDSAATLAKDRVGLETFVEWIGAQGAAGHRLSIFFNPYGEGLIHRWYKDALIALSNMEHVDKVAIQTNLSADLNFTEALDRDKVAFWATYHPGQIQEDKFLAQCMTLYARGIPFSVGSVGLRSAFAAIASLRTSLPEDVYLWVNAYKDKPDYYTSDELSYLSSIDPHFAINAMDYESLGKICNAGRNVFYVQGSGLVKRCYKDRGVIGNLYRDGLEGLSAERSCRMQLCDCYIGYIHMPQLGLQDIYGSGLLERIPPMGDSKR